MGFTRSGVIPHSRTTGKTATDHHTATVAGDIDLANLNEKLHASLATVTADQHHAQVHTIPSHSDGEGDISVKTNDASTQSIPNSATTNINMDGEDFDTDSMHDNVTNNDRITIVTAGKYLVGFIMGMANNATGRRAFIMVLNASTTILDVETGTNQNQAHFDNGSVIMDLDVDDYVDVAVLQTSGGALSTVDGAGSPMIWAVRLGA